MELAAVMVVTAIIAGTAIVSLSGTVGNRPTMAARQFQRDLTFARQRAVATGARTWVEVLINVNEDEWKVLAEDPDNPGKGNATVLNDPATNGPFIQQVETGQYIGVEITSTIFDAGNDIGFDWLGRPLNATEALLAVQGSVTFTDGHIVTVEPDTGHVAYVAP